jgi:hypothetical protein
MEGKGKVSAKWSHRHYMNIFIKIVEFKSFSYCFEGFLLPITLHITLFFIIFTHQFQDFDKL